MARRHKYKFKVWKLWLEGPIQGQVTDEQVDTRFTKNEVYGMGVRWKCLWLEELCNGKQVC